MNHLAFSINEMVTKFRTRNANFSGGFSLVGTSFEALFLFDLLANQSTCPEFWKLKFEPTNFFAFGMPSGLLVSRNALILKPDFEINNCKFFNILHPMDPIAQRFEPLIESKSSQVPPESIENASSDRIDFIIPEGSSYEHSNKNYFTSDIIILRIINEIYHTKKMDSM